MTELDDAKLSAREPWALEGVDLAPRSSGVLKGRLPFEGKLTRLILAGDVRLPWWRRKLQRLFRWLGIETRTYCDGSVPEGLLIHRITLGPHEVVAAPVIGTLFRSDTPDVLGLGWPPVAFGDDGAIEVENRLPFPIKVFGVFLCRDVTEPPQ